MTKSDAPESKNLFVQLAKRKAQAQAEGKKFGVLGTQLSTQFQATTNVRSYQKRGGRNGSGKP